MKKQIINLVIIFTASVSIAQLKAQVSDSPFPKMSVGLSPSSLLSVYSGFQASADFRMTDKLNSANEFTYIFGLLDTPGFRIKSGVHFLLKEFKHGCITLGPNVVYQKVKTDLFFNHSFTFSERANQLPIYFNQNRFAVDMLGSVRFNLSKKLIFEFGLGAGMHFTNDQVTDATSQNLRQLLLEEPEFTYEEGSNSSWNGLLTSFNINFSYVIQE